MKTGAELIAEERKRQIEVEGWTAEHDTQHLLGDMAVAGSCYALEAVSRLIPNDGKVWSDHYRGIAISDWPWDRKWWKPTPDDPIRQLTKAGALIAAEIDRLQSSTTPE